MFPPCAYEGHVKTQIQKRFCRLKMPARLVTLDTCLACPHAHPVSDRLEPLCSAPMHEPSTCIHRGPLLRMDEIKGGCCGVEVIPIMQCARHGACSVDRQAPSARSCEGCHDHQTPADPTLPPLTGPANLMWFVYPRRETQHIWTEQQEKIVAALDRFDGLKVCAIATDEHTDAAAIDRSRWDRVTTLPNDPQQWELPGWRWGMEQLKDQPGFTVRLHAKGTTRGTLEQHLKAWWTLAYETLLDVDRVRTELQRYAVSGVFRRNQFASNLDVRWHYTGSFYAFRNDLIFSRDWLPTGKVSPTHYVESWPALVAKREETGCLAFEGCRDLYDSRNWIGPPAEKAAS